MQALTLFEERVQQDHSITAGNGGSPFGKNAFDFFT
jgi:hypothetical protein